MRALKNLRMRNLNTKVYSYYRKTFNGKNKMIAEEVANTMYYDWLKVWKDEIK